MTVVQAIGRLLLVASMITMTLAVAVGVFFRYVVNQPLLWSDEVASSSLAWMTFIGAALLYGQREGHITLTFLTDRLSPPTRRVVEFLGDCVELCLLAVVAVGGIIFIQFNRDAVTSALELPLYSIYAVVPVSACIAIAFLIIRMSKGPRPRPEHPSHGGEHG